MVKSFKFFLSLLILVSIISKNVSYGQTLDFIIPKVFGPGISSREMVKADFNNDLNIDLAISLNTGGITFFQGDAFGNFAASGNITNAINYYHLSIHDFNNDGKLDLAALHSSAGVNKTSVFLGNGTGGFSSPITTSQLSGINDLVSGDFNNDGKLDIAVATDGMQIGVALGTGSGSFNSMINYSLSGTNYSLVTNDFNADGKLDIAVAGYGLEIMTGSGTGSFILTQSYYEGLQPIRIECADFNNDGKKDLLTTNSTNGLNPGISVFSGIGNGTFSTPTNYPGSYAQPELSDLNNDGYLDICQAISNTIAVRKGTSTGTFLPAVQTTIVGGASSFCTGDFNKDNKKDIVFSNNAALNISELLGNGDGTFETPRIYATGFPPGEVEKSDLNNDGFTDIVMTKNSGGIGFFQGDGLGNFSILGNIVSTTTFTQLTLKDFNNDGKMDIAALQNSSGYKISVFLGNGLGGFSSAITTSGLTGINELVTGDFNGDGKLDIAVGTNGPQVGVALGTGTGAFSSMVNYAISGPNYGLTVNDFNGDNKLDIAVAGYGLEIISGSGTGSFTLTYSYVDNVQPVIIENADMNNDGVEDLVCSNTVSGLSIYLGNANGTFQAPIYLSPGGTKYAIADFNGDRILDIAVNTLIFVNKGNAVFHSPVTIYSMGGSVIANDFNGDGKVDIGLTSSTGNTLTVLIIFIVLQAQG